MKVTKHNDGSVTIETVVEFHGGTKESSRILLTAEEVKELRKALETK